MSSEPTDNTQEIEELLVDWECSRQQGKEISIEALCGNRPELVAVVAERIAVLQQLSWMDEPIDENEEENQPHLVDQATIGAVDETQIPNSDVTVAEFVQKLTNSGVLSQNELQTLQHATTPDRVNQQQRAFALAHELVSQNLITAYQAKVILERGDSPLLLDRYVILDSIGGGGMGIVFKALQRSLERVVAVKVLPKHAVDSPEKIERFQREMRAAAKLSHPNVVQAFDAHESNGIYFFAMEYVPGCDLAQLVNEQGRLPVEQAIDITSQAASGLANAHENDIIHRDVKPGNILLSDDGVAKVLDLGLARVREITSPVTSLTRDGLTMGTVTYMSPEQAFDAKQADEQSDIYSLGCTLYFLLNGRPIFDEPNSVQTVIAHRERPAPSLGEGRDDVPEGLERLFQQMVAKSPNDRPASMTVVQRELTKLQQELATQTAATSSSNKTDAQSGLNSSARADSGQNASATTAIADAPQPPTHPNRGRLFKWATLAIGLAAIAALAFVAFSKFAQPPSARSLATQLINDELSLFVATDVEEFQADYIEELPDGPFAITGAILYSNGRVSFETLKLPTDIDTLYVVSQAEDTLPLGDLPGREQFLDLGELSFDGYQISAETLKWVVAQPKLRVLDLTRCELPEDWSAIVADAKFLTDLTLTETTTTNADLEDVAKLKDLRFLDVSNTQVTSDGLRSLSSLPITELGLTGLKLHASLKELQQFSRLRRLYVDGTNLADEMAEWIALLPELRLLHAGHTKLTTEGVRSLSQIKTLRELGLRGLEVNSAVDGIVEIPKLRDLLLDNTDLDDEGLEKLSELQRLSYLYASGTKVTDAAVERFKLRVPSCLIVTETLEDQIARELE